MDAFINWKRLNDKILCNKRIWKYICLFYCIYRGSNKIFKPWYHPNYKPNVSIPRSIHVSNIDKHKVMIEGVHGLNAHKPSSNCVILINQMVHCYLLIYKNKLKYAFMPFDELTKSFHPNYINKDIENHILDIHIAVWSFLLFADISNIIKKGQMNSNDKIMIFHHLLALGWPTIYKYHGNGGIRSASGAFWLENTAIFSMIGALIRVIYTKRRPDKIALRYISDIFFMIHTFFFFYSRIILVPNWVKDVWNVGVMDKYNQYSKLSRLFFLIFIGINGLGMLWVVQSIKLMGTHIIQMINGYK